MDLPAWLIGVDWSGTLTIAGAALGAVLGVVNTWWALGRDRVRLRIVPLWHTQDGRLQSGQVFQFTSAYAGILDAHPTGRFGVRVINRGFMDVTIEGLGFTPNGFIDRHFRKSKLVRRVIVGDADERVRLPHRLAPRDSITIWCSYRGDKLDSRIHDARRVYVNTACGLDVFATSGLFRRFCRRAAASRKAG